MNADLRSNLRLWIVVVAALILVVLGAGWFLGISPMLTSAAAADSASEGVIAQNQGLEAKLATLSRTAARTDELTAKAAVLAKSVPATLKPNTFVRRLNTVAAEDGVTIQSLSTGAPVAYTAPASVQAAAAAAAAAAAPAATPAPSASASAPTVAAPAAPLNPALAATDSSISAANFTDVPVSLQIKGSADAVLQFVKDMQGDERLFLVSTISTATDTTDTTVVTATIGGLIYTLKQ